MSKGNETRNRIIQQAAPLFNKRGLAGVSISDIMQATDLQKGGIYRHFNSKEDIALAAFDHNYQQLTQHIMNGLSQQPTHRHQLNRFLDNFSALLNRIDGGCPVLNTATEHDDGNPTLRDRARDGAANWHKTLTTLLKSGVHQGDFRADINITEIATLYLAALEGAIMLSRLYDDPAYLHRVVNSLKQHAETQIYNGSYPE
jgi:TetR/AcrR family transcriptional regulator, transcriptional repressor for nem operon